MINPGKYNRKIKIYNELIEKDEQGFSVKQRALILEAYASVKTTRGMTIIRNDSDFEKAYTNFTIRFPNTVITRDMLIEFNGKTYTIEYLNNVHEENIELEIQAKEVMH